MMNPTLHTWEHLSPAVSRYAVPGGWLYNACPAPLAFVPDPTAPHVVWETPEARAEREREHAVVVRAAVEAYLREHWAPSGQTYFSWTRDGWLAEPHDLGVWIKGAEDSGHHYETGANWLADVESNPVWTHPIWTHPIAAPIAAIIRQHTEASP